MTKTNHAGVLGNRTFIRTKFQTWKYSHVTKTYVFGKWIPVWSGKFFYMLAIYSTGLVAKSGSVMNILMGKESNLK